MVRFLPAMQQIENERSFSIDIVEKIGLSTGGAAERILKYCAATEDGTRQRAASG
jgi:hypothetical protein